MLALPVDKQGAVWAPRGRTCFSLPPPEEERRVEEVGLGVRHCRGVAVFNSFALCDLLEKLPSASCVLAQNTVRSSCFKGERHPPLSHGACYF